MSVTPSFGDDHQYYEGQLADSVSWPESSSGPSFSERVGGAGPIWPFLAMHLAMPDTIVPRSRVPLLPIVIPALVKSRKNLIIRPAVRRRSNLVK